MSKFTYILSLILTCSFLHVSFLNSQENDSSQLKKVKSLKNEIEYVLVKKATHSAKLQGYTRAYSFVTLRSELSGKCILSNHEIGDLMKKGNTAFQFDPVFKKIELEQLKNRYSLNKISLAYYEKEIIRNKKLLKSEAVSESTFDEIKYKRDLSLIESKEILLSIEKTKEELMRYRVSAPAHFRLIEKYVEVNSYVNPGMPLAKYGDYRRLVVPFSVSESQWKALQKKTEIRIQLTGYEKPLKAKILRRHFTFSAEDRKIKIDMEIFDIPFIKSGGMEVFLEFDYLPKESNFIIPASAIKESYGNYYVVSQNGERIKVRLLQINNGHKNDQVEIISNHLKENQKLRVIKKN